MKKEAAAIHDYTREMTADQQIALFGSPDGRRRSTRIGMSMVQGNDGILTEWTEETIEELFWVLSGGAHSLTKNHLVLFSEKQRDSALTPVKQIAFRSRKRSI